MSDRKNGECSNARLPSHPNWQALANVHFSWKQFVRESKGNEGSGDPRNVSTRIVSTLTGKECRAIYEEVISLPSEADYNGKTVAPLVAPDGDTELPSDTPRYRQLSNSQLTNALMKEAADNNVKALISLLGDSKDVDVRDQFGWTMLMCASHSGAIDVVRYLLSAGANTTLKDKSGYTCRALAKRQQHFDVMKLIDNFTAESKRDSVSFDITTNNCIFCKECNDYFNETSKYPHSTSTIHLFNTHPRSHRTWYGISENNKGYALLLKNGWKREEGLGPKGLGKKFPPKTVLKRDRKGIGNSVDTARVTHFKPYDTSAICSRHKREHKISRGSNTVNDKLKERILRRELNF